MTARWERVVPQRGYRLERLNERPRPRQGTRRHAAYRSRTGGRRRIWPFARLATCGWQRRRTQSAPEDEVPEHGRLITKLAIDAVEVLQDQSARAEQERAQQTRLAVADERNRIARDMHDVIAHGLP